MNDLLSHIALFLKEAKSPLLVVGGPTASGKTRLSVKLAEEFNGEIISADSMQVYKKMHIGTDKIDAVTRKRVKHHLIDIRNPDERFTMADFKREAQRAITDISNRNKLPILCGGTGLYLNAVVENYELQGAGSDPVIREKLQKLYEEQGADHLYNMLLDLDPKTAAKIHPNNVRFVARSLEVVMQTKKPIEPRGGKRMYDVFKIGINWDREILYDRINKRVDEMLDEGLINEIKSLMMEGYDEKCDAMSGLGYKEYFPYLSGEKPLEECLALHKQRTRNYAKRQLTWFRKEEDIYWIEPEEFYKITDS
ncbi:MAG: tRNA dimethylallyltransferase [Oceanicoccus sp.]|jgi:tRNA dimethylallyltransferase